MIGGKQPNGRRSVTAWSASPLMGPIRTLYLLLRLAAGVHADRKAHGRLPPREQVFNQAGTRVLIAHELSAPRREGSAGLSSRNPSGPAGGEAQ